METDKPISTFEPDSQLERLCRRTSIEQLGRALKELEGQEKELHRVRAALSIEDAKVEDIDAIEA